MKKLIIKISFLVLFVIIFSALLIVKSNVDAANYFVKNISLPYVSFIANITSFLPFSLFEFTVAILVIFSLITIIYTIIKLFKKQFLKSLYLFLNLMIVASFSLSYFTFTQGIGYNCNFLHIELMNDSPSKEYIDEVITYYLQDLNAVTNKMKRDGNNITQNPYTLKELNNLINEEYLSHPELNISSYSPKISTLTFSSLFLEFHITGVTFLGAGQTSVSQKLHGIELPFVIGHEIAHMKGVAKEDDANLTSLYILLQSKNEYLRYSGYYWSFLSLLSIYQQTNYQLYEEVFTKINPLFLKDINHVNQYYTEHDILSSIGSFINNIYLIFNGNENGVNDYSDNSVSVDTGQTDNDGHPIYQISEYSPFQKLYFQLYSKICN